MPALLLFAPRTQLLAENLFLRKQLALFKERGIRPRRTTPFFRLIMVAPSRLFPWRNALMIVQPETFLKWHRTAFRAFWTRKSRVTGRPPLPKNLRTLIRQMAAANPTWRGNAAFRKRRANCRRA